MINQFLADAVATRAFGRELGAAFRPGQVLALTGDVGAGKTALAQGIAEGCGVHAAVTSPTFPLVHEYSGERGPLYHFDFYRPGHEGELLAIGWDDYLGGDGMVMVEWADRFPALLPPEARWFHLASEGTGRRVREHAGPPA